MIRKGLIVITCGEASIADRVAAMLEKNCEQIDWDTLHQCYAFVAEGALISKQ